MDIFASLSNVSTGSTLSGAQFAAGIAGTVAGCATVALAIGACIEGGRAVMQASVTEVVGEMGSYGGPRGAPHGAQKGQLYHSDYQGSFIAPNGHTVSGTDGSGILLYSTPVSKVTYMSDGNESWLAVGFECADGSTYAWDNDAQWYTDAAGKEFKDHALMDLTNVVGDAVEPIVQGFVDSDDYNDALKSFKDAYHAHGGSVGSFVWEGVKSFAGELSAGGHRSTMAWGGIGLNVVSGGYGVSLIKVPSGFGSLEIPIYRVYGNGAKINGKSYSLFNPLYVPYYRNFAGLPNSNSGIYLLKGYIPLKDIRCGRWFASPLDGRTGGLPFELYQDFNQLSKPVNIILKKPF